MIYAYVRVSTDKQTVENQRFEIQRFAESRSMTIDKWVSETISSRKQLRERAFGALLKRLEADDVLIVSEISRMGRNLMQIMRFLHLCMERNIKVLAIKEGYELGDNINSKVLAFAFGLSAEIERNLISQRIKEALARRKAEGHILGRPKGRKNATTVLTPHFQYIEAQLAKGTTQTAIAKRLKVHRQTIVNWLREKKKLSCNTVVSP